MKTVKKRINIFIAIAPLQLLAISSILKDKQYKPDETNICFIFYKSDIIFDIPNCKILRYNTRGVKAYLKAMIQFRLEMKKILACNAKLSVYLPHPYHLPTNYLLFGIRDRDVYLIPDGLLNYCESGIPIKYMLLMMIKVVLALILGIRYKPYIGHLTAYDKKVYRGVYTFNKEGLVTNPGVINTIDLKQKGQIKLHADTDKRICLFLDQDIESLVGKKKAEKIRSHLHSYLLSENFDTVFYKRHPTAKFLPGAFDTKFPVNHVRSALPVEMLMEELRPGEVLSFSSSALINIRDIFPEILCTSVGLNKILAVNKNSRMLKDLFIKKGVKMIDV